ncbi:DUF3108 domain-containing protein [Kaarinaea lacus]
MNYIQSTFSQSVKVANFFFTTQCNPLHPNRFNNIYYPGYLIAIIVFLVSGAATAASPLPEQFTAHYQISKGALTVGETVRKLTPTKNGQFIFHSETNAKGIASLVSDAHVEEQSTWHYHDGLPKPVEYIYKNSTAKKIRDVRLLFDWEKQRVTNIINGDPWNMALVPELLDKLLFQLKLMQDLSGGVKTFNYKVADGGHIKDYVVEEINKETINIDLGVFSTTVLRRTTKHRTTTWWCAKELHFLPIIIQQISADGSRVIATLSKLEGLANTQPTSEKTQ